MTWDWNWLKQFVTPPQKTSEPKKVRCNCRGECHDWNCEAVL